MRTNGRRCSEEIPSIFRYATLAHLDSWALHWVLASWCRRGLAARHHQQVAWISDHLLYDGSPGSQRDGQRRSAVMGGQGGTGRAMEFGDPGVQIKTSLRPPGLPDAPLTPPLASYGPVRLPDQVVTAGRRDPLLVIDIVENRKLAGGGPVTRQLVRTGCFWNVMYAQQLLNERLCGVCVLVARMMRELATEMDAPGANRPAGDVNTALEQQLLDIPVTQGRAVGERPWA